LQAFKQDSIRLHLFLVWCVYLSINLAFNKAVSTPDVNALIFHFSKVFYGH